MKIQYKTQPQPYLWAGAGDYPVKNFAHARNVVGEIIEEMTAELTGARRLKTDGTNPYCPDLLWHGNTLIETKASGKNGNVIVYEGRLAKDLATITTPWELYYWVWRHRADCKAGGTCQSLRGRIIDTLQSITILPLPRVARVCATRPPRLLNSAYTVRGGRLGYGNAAKGYGRGWCLPVSLWACFTTHATTVRAFGRDVNLLWATYGE